MLYIEKLYPKPSSPCNCLNMRRASRAISQFYDKVMEPSGLTISQFGLLRHIHNAGVVSITELSQLIRIDRTTLNRNLKPLKDAALIRLAPGTDSRVKEVSLTEAGKLALEAGVKLWQEAQADMQEYFGETDLKQLNQLIARLEALVP